MIPSKHNNKNVTSQSRLIRREIERTFSEDKKVNKKDLKKILFKMKYSLQPDISEPIINNLDKNNRDFILGCPLPITFRDLRTQGLASFKFSFHSEINWLSLSLKNYHNEINLFLAYEKEFEASFLVGDYKLAKEIIDKVDAEVCVSHWSIEKRLLLVEYSKEETENKNELIALIKNDAERLVCINSSYLSTRFEIQLPTNRYEDILEKFVSKQRNKELGKYFLFRLNYYKNISIESPELALYLESNLSIIDRYRIFLQIALSILCKGNDKEESYLTSLSPCIFSLSEYINDDSLLNMSVFLGNSPSNKNYYSFVPYLKILHEYNGGNFLQCYKLCFDELKSNPFLIEAAELLVKSSIILEKDCPVIGQEDSLINKIIEDLFNIFSKNSNYESSLYSLDKIANSICSPVWCNKLIDIINFEESKTFNSYNFDLHRILSSSFLSPELCYYINEEKAKETFLDFFKKADCFSNYVFAKVDEKDFNLNGTSIIYDLKCIQKNLFDKDYESSLTQINKLFENEKYKDIIEISFIKLEIIKKHLLCLVELGQTKTALELVCHNVVRNEKFFFALSNENLLLEVLKSDDENIQKSICTPILARLYRDRINDIWIAYDNFMYFNNFTFPRELFDCDFCDGNLLNYFLKYVCIQDIYDSSPSFSSPEQLDNERIAVCNYLCVVDPNDKESYVSEITETEKRALIKKGIKEIDESKIYVDVNGIWRQLEAEVRERFSRGQELLKLSKERIDYLLEMSSSVLYLFLPTSEEEGGIIKFDRSQDKLEGIANHPHYENFKETFMLIRDRFISSNEYGLDSYISIRIRHGTLLGEIRSIFEKYSLITKRNTYTKQYIENDHWIGRLVLDESNRASISEKLNAFSEKIDLMSDQIKNSLLQIKTEDKSSEGLFDFRFGDEELIKLYEKKFYTIDNHNLFFETAIGCLWERTESDLNVIREKFTSEYSVKVLNDLEELYNSIEKYFKKSNSTIDMSEFLRDITACKTDTTNAFEKISLWFRRSYSNSINEFDLNLLINISLSIIKKMHPKTPILNAEIINSSKVVLKGEYFAFLIDIMRNILDNIIMHAELTEPLLKVIISVSESKGKLKIAFENNVADSIDLDRANQKIATTQYRINNNEESALIKKEGGSGYMKIKNILNINLKRKRHEIVLESIKDDRMFKSYISFELDNLLK